MTLPMFVVRQDIDKPADFPAHSGEQYILPSAISTHALKSMRLGEGEQLCLTDGLGRVATARVSDTAAGTVMIEAIDQIEVPCVKLGLIQALAKSGRDEQAIEMATEIGVDSVMPWQSQRSIVQWKGNKAEKALRKWKDVLVSATEQSRRALLPQLESMKTTKQLVEWTKQATEAGDIVVVLHQDATDTWSRIEEHVKSLNIECTIWVAVGPESGISDDEVAQLTAAGAHVCVIGSNILRASSAGSVALTLLSRVLERYA